MDRNEPRMATGQSAAVVATPDPADESQSCLEGPLCEALLAAVGEGLIVFSPVGRVERVNDRFCELTGFTREQVIGAEPPFPWWPDGQAERMRRALGDLVGGATLPRELPIRTASGEQRVVRSTPGSVRDSDGRVLAHVVTFDDITDQWDAADALRASEARLSAVLGSMAEGVIVQDAGGRIVMANEAACRILGLSEDQLHGRTSMDPRWQAVHLDGSPFPGEDHPVSVTLRTGRSVREVLMGVDSPARGERRWILVNSDAFGPLDSEGRPSAAVATFTDVTEFQRRSDEIRLQRDFTDMVVGAMGEGLLVLDPDQRVSMVNDQFCALVGLEREQIVGRTPPFPWWPGDLVDQYREVVADLATADGRPREFEIVRPGGERVPVEATRIGATHPSGVPGMLLVTARDISARRDAERALRDSEERYRTAVQATRDGMIIVGSDTRVRACNVAACGILGVAEDELIGREFGGLGRTVVDEDGSEIPFPRRPLMATLATGRLQPPITVGLERPGDGRQVWVIEACSPLGLLDGLGRPEAALITLTDITHLRLAQDQLRASEERYRALFGYQADAVVRISPTRRVLGGSPSVWRVLRFDPTHLPGSLIECVHPEDRDRAIQGFDRMAAGAVGIRFLVRIRRGDGRWIWGEVTGGPVYDDHGDLVEVQQSVRDVSDRVRMEQDSTALHRISEIIAGGAPADVVFARVAEELGASLDVGSVRMVRFDQNLGTTVGLWERGAREQPESTLRPIDLAGDHSPAAVVWRSGQPSAVIRSSPGTGTEEPDVSLAVPIHFDGWPWGCLEAGPIHEERQEEVERRLLRFADLTGIAIGANAERERLHDDAETDPLTGLSNRRAFAERLTREISAARHNGRPLSVITIDLDHFKAVNDLHGHGAGDLVLQHVADRIRLMARSGDVLARLGGDEFAWILPDTPLATAVVRADLLRDRIGGAPLPNTELTITASLGVTQLTQADDLDSVLRRADAALYEAKRLGGHRVVVTD